MSFVLIGKTYTAWYQKHEPSGLSYIVKCTNERMSKPAKVYRWSNVVETFLSISQMKLLAAC
jgi:hypothetical protein